MAIVVSLVVAVVGPVTVLEVTEAVGNIASAVRSVSRKARFTRPIVSPETQSSSWTAKGTLSNGVPLTSTEAVATRATSKEPIPA